MSEKVQNASDVILVGFQHLIYGMDRKTISREVEARGGLINYSNSLTILHLWSNSYSMYLQVLHIFIHYICMYVVGFCRKGEHRRY